MSPTVPHNSYAVFHHFTWGDIALGTKVKVDHARYGKIIKTICHIDNNGLYWLAGENDHSLSTLQMGPINKSQILGILLLAVKPDRT